MVMDRRSGDSARPQAQEGQSIPASRRREEGPAEALPKPHRGSPQAGSPSSEPGLRKPRRRPLVELCRASGWEVRHLGSAPGKGEEIVDLCIKELIAIRRAGFFDLTIALADAAEGVGLSHPRIEANRERARRARKRGSRSGQATTATPVAPSPVSPGRGGREASIQGRNPGPLGRLRTLLARLTPVSLVGRLPSRRTVAPAEQLRRLRAICSAAGWDPVDLGPDAAGDVALACGREMQRSRQAGLHTLVVELGTEAALLGLDHERIRNNLERARARTDRDRTVAEVSALLDGNEPLPEATLTRLVEATLAELKHGDYRRLLEECLKREMERRGTENVLPELRRPTVLLEVNQRLLDALERRFQP